jgi:3-dehydroquinate dehydratase-2
MAAGDKPAAGRAGGEQRGRGCLYILNGPNLNLLGQREPAVYGTTTLEQIRECCEAKAKSLGFTIDFRQTNFEGELVESVQQARQAACGIIINPAGYSFTSVALLDALKMFERPKIELHISNVHARESIYHNSLVSRTATGIIVGLGAAGYEIAIQAMAGLVNV